MSVGIVNIPCNYNNGDAGEILAIYEMAKKASPYGEGPEADFRALSFACQTKPSICGAQLTQLLIQAGPSGTAGAANQNMLGEQLLENVVSISAALTGVGKNKAVGTMGQMATQARLQELGYRVQEEVTFRTRNGVKFRVDFMSLKDGEYVGWEVKTEGEGRSARVEGPQKIGYEAIAAGEEVYPEGANAEAIGLEPGVGILFRMEFDIYDRPEEW